MSFLKITFSVLILLISSIGYCQTIEGTVVNASSGKPLSYVHIGVFNKNLGVISDQQGHFKIDLKNTNKEQFLSFSIIGYAKKDIRIGDLGNGIHVKLQPIAYQLEEVVVRDAKINETFQVGFTKPSKTTSGSANKDHFGWGMELGVIVPYGGRSGRVESIHFHHRYNTLDSVLYRLNIYELKNNYPDASILTEEIFVMCRKKDKWVSKNVSDLGLDFNRNLFFSVEVVRQWKGNANNIVLFWSHPKNANEVTPYIRKSSMGEWSKELAVPLTLYLTIAPWE